MTIDEIRERLAKAKQFSRVTGYPAANYYDTWPDLEFLLARVEELEAKLSDCLCWVDKHCALHSVGIAAAVAESSRLRAALERVKYMAKRFGTPKKKLRDRDVIGGESPSHLLMECISISTAALRPARQDTKL